MASSSTAGLRSSSQLVFKGSSRLNASATERTVSSGHNGLSVRVQQGQSEPEASCCAVLEPVASGLTTGSFTQSILADAKTIKVGGPPPSGEESR